MFDIKSSTVWRCAALSSPQAGELFRWPAGTGSAMNNDQRALLHLIFRKSIMKAAGFLSCFSNSFLELVRPVSHLDPLVEGEIFYGIVFFRQCHRFFHEKQ